VVQNGIHIWCPGFELGLPLSNQRERGDNKERTPNLRRW
jgi:hypothetical protein